jgi:hypothetical protein
MDVRQTKRPRQNTAMRAYFCLGGRLSRLRTGTGIRHITTSVMMFREALANHTPKRLRQWPPMLESQKYDTGVHMNAVANTDHSP